ncbi:hypothetical protein ACOZB2_24705 [Pantoea endophytica]|uniref:Uncharacterized protein n=1 Tax=Pantoea sp. BJ2 TaxID=3141322 RepID=A0AAU7U3Q7_9GAMM
MTISTSQSRVTVGTYCNKRHDNIPKIFLDKLGVSVNRSTIPSEIVHFRNRVCNVTNCQKELERPTHQNVAQRQSVLVPLFLLLSQVRLAGNPGAEGCKNPAFISSKDLTDSAPLVPVNHDNTPNSISVIREQAANVVHEIEQLIIRYDPLTFPSAYALPVNLERERLKQIERIPRHVVYEKRTSPAAPEPVDILVEKIDFSCIEEMNNLTVADIFRQIGKTLSSPIKELVKDIEVLHYSRYGRCPTAGENERIISIASGVDKTISFVTGFIPGCQPLIITQRLGGKLFEMFGDAIDNKELNKDDVLDVDEQLLTLGRSIADYAPRGHDGNVIENKLEIPRGMNFKNNKIVVNINGIDRDVLYENNKVKANYKGRYEEISYSYNSGEWYRVRKGKSIIGYISGDKTPGGFMLSRKKNGWDIYKRVDSETGQLYSKSYVLSKRGKLIPFRVIKSEIRRYQDERELYLKNACEINIHRAKRSPCTISGTVNSLGLVEQKGFAGKLYRADKRSPDELSSTDVFGPSGDFTAIEKMRAEGEALIVSESLEGVLRYISSQGETYHLYEISADDVRGCSLRGNINGNSEGVKKYLSVAPEKGGDIDWGYETNGAIFLFEAHVYPEDITIEKVKYLGTNHDAEFKNKIQSLEHGSWKNYM